MDEWNGLQLNSFTSLNIVLKKRIYTFQTLGSSTVKYKRIGQIMGHTQGEVEL